jgi:hypothetical protein
MTGYLAAAPVFNGETFFDVSTDNAEVDDRGLIYIVNRLGGGGRHPAVQRLREADRRPGHGLQQQRQLVPFKPSEEPHSVRADCY